MRVLVVTAVAAERDAVVRGASAPGADGGTSRSGGTGTSGSSGTGTGTSGSSGSAAEASGSVVEFAVPGYVLHRPAPAGPEPLVIDVLAAGVGPAAAAAGTATALAAAALSGSPYGLAVSAGIGGGFATPAPGRSAAVGSVVVADAIVAADLGAETPAGFVPVTDLGFGTVEHLPPEALVRAVAEAAGAQRGEVLTVSTVTGSAERAAALAAARPGALAEAMEGFGVAEAAAAHGVPVLEIRAVSNPVGPRDRAAWRIGDALEALAGASAALREALRAAPAETWSAS